VNAGVLEYWSPGAMRRDTRDNRVIKDKKQPVYEEPNPPIFHHSILPFFLKLWK
jgi:hypothetical protein